MPQLRAYQQKAVKMLVERTMAGVKRTILQMATGSGKTAVFCFLLMSCFAKGKRGLMVVRGAKLVHQAAARLAMENVPHGLFQAGKTRNVNKRILVCSIDTLYARKIAPDADFIVIDEAHLSQGTSYKWLLGQEKYKDAVVLGVTATPFAKDGLEHVGTEIIHPVTIGELIDQGYLVGGKYYVPFIPDLAGVKSSKNDYITKQLEDALKKESSAIFGHLEKTWRQYGEGKKSLVFCCSVAHAREVQAQMSGFGARVGHVDATIPMAARDATIRDLENGTLDAITSVGCLTTGVDIPSLETIFMLRPTKSYNLWVQMLGRGTRPFPGKSHFTLIDLSGNLYKHGPIEAEMRGQIEPTRGDPPSPKQYTCFKCFNTVTRETFVPVYGPRTCCFAEADREHRLCPACGTDICILFWQPGGKPQSPEQHDTDIREYEIQAWERRLPILVDIAKHRGYKKGWITHSIRKEFGEEAADQAFLRIRSLRKWPLRDQADFTPRPSTIPSRSSTSSTSAGYGPTTRAL